jgi:NAD(P)-dependent dehydrogenase (short-subunit alcohol dehydrogenase family)
MHMGTNHLAHFLLTLMLVPSLKAGAATRPAFGARVVHVASSMHLLVPGIDPGNPELRRKYNAEAAYSQSKLAQVGPWALGRCCPSPGRRGTGPGGGLLGGPGEPCHGARHPHGG